MKGLTNRDKSIYAFINQYGSITIDQCSKIFMQGNRRKYEIAARRLRRLVENQYIKMGKIMHTNENQYYIDNKLRYHDSLVIQYCAELINIGASNVKFERNKKWDTVNIISDGFIYFEINNKSYIHLIEVCLTNKDIKLDKYEQLYISNYIQNQYGIEPKLIVVSVIEDLNQHSNIIPISCFDFNFNNIVNKIL